MKKAIICVIILLFTVSCCLGQATNGTSSETIKVEADPGKEFYYPYYLYIPSSLREANAQKHIHTLLVAPNNTGTIDDNLSVHEESVKKQIPLWNKIASKLDGGTAILMPVFPRTKTYPLIYTHALDRDSLITDKNGYQRFDLQLIAMIDHARARLKKENIKIDKRVFITGFSASGMFSNRFTFLHPDRVKADASGSPGGWAIAPIAKYKDKALRYPIGIADLKDVSGKEFPLNALRKVPIFIYMGDKDDNDSVVYFDGYEAADKDLIFELFGKSPVERWEINKTLYQDGNLNATFKLYPGVKHTINNDMIADVVAFFTKYKG